MSTDQELEQAAEEIEEAEITEQEQEEQSGTLSLPDQEKPEEQDELSVEERASRMGWKPKEEYTGEHEWVDAEAFLERTENDAKYLRKSLSQLERNYTKLEKTTEAILNHTQRQVAAAEKEGYEKAMQEINERMAKAVENSDIEAANEALKDRDNLNKKISEKQQTHDPNEDIVAAWKARNTWFDEDPVLADAAAKMTDFLANRGRSVKEQLEGAEKYIRETFPQKFRDEEEEMNQRRNAPILNGASNNVRQGKNLKIGTYEALKPEIKVECDRFVKEITQRTKRSEADAKKEFLKFAEADMYMEGAK